MPPVESDLSEAGCQNGPGNADHCDAKLRYLARRKDRRERRKELGLCVDCRNEVEERGRTRCEKCRARRLKNSCYRRKKNQGLCKKNQGLCIETGCQSIIQQADKGRVARCEECRVVRQNAHKRRQLQQGVEAHSQQDTRVSHSQTLTSQDEQQDTRVSHFQTLTSQHEPGFMPLLSPLYSASSPSTTEAHKRFREATDQEYRILMNRYREECQRRWDAEQEKKASGH